MPKRTIFEDAADKFFVDDDGDLNQTDAEGETYSLITSENLEEFIGWLTDEADRLKAEKAEGQTGV